MTIIHTQIYPVTEESGEKAMKVVCAADGWRTEYLATKGLGERKWSLHQVRGVAKVLVDWKLAPKSILHLKALVCDSVCYELERVLGTAVTLEAEHFADGKWERFDVTEGDEQEVVVA